MLMIARCTCNTSLYLRRCKGKHCKTENLGGAMEHRCCVEVLNIQGKLVFDGSIDNLDCITQHEEYKAITNKAVLENVVLCACIYHDIRTRYQTTFIAKKTQTF